MAEKVEPSNVNTNATEEKVLAGKVTVSDAALKPDSDQQECAEILKDEKENDDDASVQLDCATSATDDATAENKTEGSKTTTKRNLLRNVERKRSKVVITLKGLQGRAPDSDVVTIPESSSADGGVDEEGNDQPAIVESDSVVAKVVVNVDICDGEGQSEVAAAS